MTFSRFSFCALLAGATFLSGCTTKAGQNANAPTSQTANANAANTLRVGLNIEPTFLDPARVQDLYTSELLTNCFEGLVRVNKENAVEPALAEKWELSADGKTYTFHLRPNVRFHNGRVLTAEDVKWSWERAVAPQTRSSVAVNYLDGVVGLKDCAAGKTPALAGVRVVNPQTLTVTLDRPRAYFLSMLAYTSNWIVCREAVPISSEFKAENVVGTGAFRLTEYKPGERIVLEAWKEYWDGKPSLLRIELPILLSGEAQYNSFVAGELDVLTGIAPSRYTQDKERGKYSGEYKMLPSANTYYLVMQQERQPVFAKKEVRQAFAFAIDRDKIIRVALRNLARTASGFVPRELLNDVTPPAAFAYNPAKAKQLLTEAGYPEGKGFPSLTLSLIQQQPEVLATAMLIQADLKQNLGIEVKLQEREAGDYFAAGNRREMECYLASWYADYPDAQNFLSTLLVTGASLNRSGYSNSQFDALCRQADQEPNTKKRLESYTHADAVLMSDVGILPLYHVPRLLLVRSNVTGVEANACTLLPFSHTTKR